MLIMKLRFIIIIINLSGKIIRMDFGKQNTWYYAFCSENPLNFVTIVNNFII